MQINKEQLEKSTNMVNSQLDKHMKEMRAQELSYDKLNETKRNLEVENKEQRQKIETLTYEVELVRNELKELRESNKSLDTTKFSQEKSITEYALKCQSLHRELEDKEQLISKV